MALKRSPEVCLKLIYKYLLKAGHFPGDICSSQFGTSRKPVDEATYDISML